MKRDQTYFYFLFVLLVMGAFAAMAQNSYGLKILGAVAAVFGLIFLVRAGSLILSKNSYKLGFIEPACLSILAFILALRVFYIHFVFVEILFVAAVVILIILYLRKMLYRFRKTWLENPELAWTVLVFHGSLVLFFSSLAMMPFIPQMAQWAGILAFLLLLVFILSGLSRQVISKEGEKATAFSIMSKYNDYSFLIISLFFLFSFYVGFNKAGVLPAIYSDEFPQAYFELVDEASGGKEKPVNGKFRHQLFKNKYDVFIKQNKIADK